MFNFHDFSILSQLLDNAYCQLFNYDLHYTCVAVTVNCVVLILMVQ